MDEELALGIALRGVIAAGAEVRQEVAKRMSLSEHELVTLEHLADVPRGPGELARLLGVSPAAATGIVDRLAERGHVERGHHAGDRRRVEVRLTPGGREAVYAQLMPMFAALREAHSGFDATERAVLRRYLHAAGEALHSSGLTRSAPPPGSTGRER
ncbi:MarR family transcriptional regulator [Nocardioides lentus]|uniref:MarR family transcriptional regulator n=1 Tax=Nocardioides lentus TaxID=338077 RepID=A0ABN2PLI3_9ACTN